MDKPHLLVRRQTGTYLRDLRSESLVIRFGATYPESEKDGVSNVVYAPGSISAFKQKLVKKTSVSAVSLHAEKGNVRVTYTHKAERSLVYGTLSTDKAAMQMHVLEMT